MVTIAGAGVSAVAVSGTASMALMVMPVSVSNEISRTLILPPAV